jgi:hypothetical protein
MARFPQLHLYASGSGLTANIVVTAPSGYEVSQTSGGSTGLQLLKKLFKQLVVFPIQQYM